MRSASYLSLLLAAAAASAVASAPSTSVTFQIAIPEYLHQQPQTQGSAPGGAADPAAIQRHFLASLPAWTRATLESRGGGGGPSVSGGGRHTHQSAPITVGGKLVFHNVTAGSYLGEVHCATHIFAPLRVDVEAVSDAGNGDDTTLTTRVTETFRGNDWANQGVVLRKVAATAEGGADQENSFLVAPLTLATKSYYTERSKFDVLSLLKNPMILMALVAMVMMFGMPKMMENMDPEMKAEFEERQKKGGILGGGPAGAAPGAGFDMAAYLAGSGDKK